MLKRLFVCTFLLTLFVSACGQSDRPADEPDVDATVQAAVDATQAVAPTTTVQPADTAVPPTDTTKPPTATPTAEPSPTAKSEETQTLNVVENPLVGSPQGRHFATDLTFRLQVEGSVVSELMIDGVTNANGNSAITYDFSNAEVAPATARVTILEMDDTTYFEMPDGTCVSAGPGDLPIGEMVVDTGEILLNTENMVTGQLQYNGVKDVNGVSTDEYLIDADNLVGTTGLTNMTSGVLNVATDGNYVVRLILEGSGASEALAPGVPGELYYELNVTPSETLFEIEVPANCTGLGDVAAGDGGGDDGEDDSGDGDATSGDTDTNDTGDGDGDAGAGGDATVELVITQVSQTISHQCQGGNVIVEGASNTIVLTGTCNEVIVNSAGNTIDVETASAIIVEGAQNEVTYSGSARIVDDGFGNVFTQR